MRTSRKSLELPRDPALKDRCPSTYDVDHLVSRFAPRVRRSVRRLVSGSSRMADLATVFPGALFAVASKRGPLSRRRKAVSLIENGALLKEVARTLDLPNWLRRLPPEAFTAPLGQVPSSEMFARRIVSRLPRHAAESALWLEAVIFASETADDYFALWLADQPLFHESAEAHKLFAALAAYAWFSTASNTRANSLILVPWRPEMALDTALCAAKSWLNRIRLVLQLPRGTLSDTWLAPGEAAGYAFQPLVEHADLLAEAKAMHNCADQYADRLAREKCRLFSVRQRGVRVATLEVGPHPREGGMLTVTQLKTRHNMPASSEVWQAAYTWLASQRGLRRTPALVPPERPLDAALWQSLMHPYRLAREGAPWMPETLNLATFGALDNSLAELARRGGVSSWLFT